VKGLKSGNNPKLRRRKDPKLFARDPTIGNDPISANDPIIVKDPKIVKIQRISSRSRLE
jgi:hypothetical protein